MKFYYLKFGGRYVSAAQLLLKIKIIIFFFFNYVFLDEIKNKFSLV